MENEISLIKSAKKDLEWFSANYAELILGHENEFIAIKNREVVASDSSFDKVITRVKEGGLDPAQLLIRYLAKTRTVLRPHS
ncbi:MAG: hypothetical protein V1728_02720 [Candidatus Micrarchaeota archaeon]